jgi:hypothetical protein
MLVPSTASPPAPCTATMACGLPCPRPRLHAAVSARSAQDFSARPNLSRAAACLSPCPLQQDSPAPLSQSSRGMCAMMAANAASLASLTPCNGSLDGHVPYLSTYAISPSGCRSSPKAPAHGCHCQLPSLQPALEAWRPAQSPEACNQWCQDKGCVSV